MARPGNGMRPVFRPPNPDPWRGAGLFAGAGARRGTESHLADFHLDRLGEHIRRIYERAPKSHAYSGDLSTGQSFLHRDDMLDAFVRTAHRRDDLPHEVTILVGEREAMGYEALQRRIGSLIHGTEDWETLALPKPVAAAGAWLEEKSEPLVPDDFDQGEPPFIKPFMVSMADDH